MNDADRVRGATDHSSVHQAYGTHPQTTDVSPTRLELATRLGAAHASNAREQDPLAAMQEHRAGRGIDGTLEATGVPAVVRQAIDVLAPRGACGIVGAPAPDGNGAAYDSARPQTRTDRSARTGRPHALLADHEDGTRVPPIGTRLRGGLLYAAAESGY